MKGCSVFPKALALFSVISRTFMGGGSYPSAEKQSVYSTAPINWARLDQGLNSVSRTISEHSTHLNHGLVYIIPKRARSYLPKFYQTDLQDNFD